jgi:DNA-binding transcriptional regulator YhcF (GntR family)
MDRTPLYREVAERIADLVAGGTFRIGDRLPSIREMSRQAQVSINTVKVAYSHLEDRCLIEARPQSGYYVCLRLNGAFWSEETRWAVESLGRMAAELCRQQS